jgi:hypothetical protein
MSNVSHDFVRVDMRGMKAALVAMRVPRASAYRPWFGPAVARELSVRNKLGTPRKPASEKLIKVSIRLSSAEVEQLAAGAQEAGLSRGAYVAALIDGGGGDATGGSPHRVDSVLRRAGNPESESLSLGVAVPARLRASGPGIPGDARLAEERGAAPPPGRGRCFGRFAIPGVPARRELNQSMKRSANMTEARHIDGVLVQWGERLFYPANRIVKSTP